MALFGRNQSRITPPHSRPPKRRGPDRRDEMSPKRLARRGPRTALLVLALSALAASGCLVAGLTAAAAGGGAAYVYLRGRVSSEFPAAFQDAHAAVLTSLRELALPLDKNEHNGITGTVLSRTGDGTVITIDIETQSSRVPADGPITLVGVRVGTFGDQATSERILGQVSSHLVQKP